MKKSTFINQSKCPQRKWFPGGMGKFGNGLMDSKCTRIQRLHNKYNKDPTPSKNSKKKDVMLLLLFDDVMMLCPSGWICSCRTFTVIGIIKLWSRLLNLRNVCEWIPPTAIWERLRLRGVLSSSSSNDFKCWSGSEEEIDPCSDLFQIAFSETSSFGSRKIWCR